MTRRLGLIVPLEIVYGMLLLASLWCAPEPAQARPQYFDAFSTSTALPGSRLDTCGVCHFDPDWGWHRNPYGMAFEVTDRNEVNTHPAVRTPFKDLLRYMLMASLPLKSYSDP